MAAFVYDGCMNGILSGSINMATDTFKWILVKQSYAAAKTDTSLTPVAAGEIVATGYAGGFAGSGRKSAPRTIVNDTTANVERVVFSANPTWTPLGGATNDTVAGVVVGKEVTNDAASKPIAFLPLGSILTGATTNGSAVVTGLASTTYVAVGMAVVGTGVSGGTTVSTINSTSQVTLSANATASGTPSLTFGSPLTTNGSDYTLTVDATNGNITFTL